MIIQTIKKARQEVVLGKNVLLLAQLQEIDLKIDSSLGEKQALLDEVASLERRVEDVNLAIAEQNSELQGVEEEKTTLEINLTAENDNIARSEERLKEIKTQKEYQAVSKEVAAAKKVKGELEEQVLQKITRIEELVAAIGEMQKTRDEIDAVAATQKSELHAKMEQLESALVTDRVERDALAKDISPSMLKRYGTLRERRQGIAIVEAKSGSCLGCNMNLPPQVYNSLFKAENFVTCPHCQRMLFLRQEGEGA